MRRFNSLSLAFFLTLTSAIAAGCPGETVDGGPDAGTPGDDAGTPGDDAGTPGDDAGTPGDDAGTPGDDAGTPGDDAGTPGDDAGTPGDDAGTPGDDAGTPGDDAGTPGGDAGTPGDDAGTPDAGVAELGLDTRPANPACVAPGRPATGADIQLTRVFPSLSWSQPIGLVQAPNDNSAFYVVEKAGRVFRVDNIANPAASSEFLNLTAQVSSGGGNDERGLLGFAFHPDYPVVNDVFVNYIRDFNGGDYSTISRIPIVNGTADEANEEILLTFRQPAGNHNGGDLKFGPEGFLYASFGDGGGGGDPFQNGQNPNTIMGSIIRIDVDGPPTAGLAYRIPDDNPFAVSGGAPEIFAWGLRNVWRFSFDDATGELWAGDVGQNAYEEVNIIENGGNYGWPVTEGFHCYNNPNCDFAPYDAPVVEYGRSLGGSITGGYVYRGGNIPGLEGVFVFGDFASGNLFGAFPDVDDGGYETIRLNATAAGVASFGQDQNGALYVVSYGQGRIFRIDANGTPAVSPVPAQLSATGCVDASDPTVLAAGVIPYSVNVPFWSDGAAKERAFAIPDGTQIGVNADGDFDFPIGSVTMKTFFRDGVRIETRLFVRHDDGEWGGYVYRWRPDQSDADLLETALIDDAPGGQWNFPNRGTCLQCHTQVAGRTLGLEVAQLDRNASYPQTGRTAPQLATLDAVGYLSGLAGASAAPYVNPFGTAPLDARARSYLQVNCASCHQPGGPVQVQIDLRRSVTTEEMGICNEDPNAGLLGIPDAKIISAADPATSILFQRVGRRDAQGMPPLASLISDSAGQTLLGDWIASHVCDGIEPPPTPIDPGTCGNPQVIDVTSNTSFDGTTVGQTNALSASCGNEGAGGGEWVFEATFPSGLVCLDTTGSAYDTVLSVREASCADVGSEVDCNDDQAQGVLTSRVEVDATSGGTFYVIVDGYSGVGNFNLNVTLGGCP